MATQGKRGTRYCANRWQKRNVAVGSSYKFRTQRWSKTEFIQNIHIKILVSWWRKGKNVHYVIRSRIRPEMQSSSILLNMVVTYRDTIGQSEHYERCPQCKKYAMYVHNGYTVSRQSSALQSIIIIKKRTYSNAYIRAYREPSWIIYIKSSTQHIPKLQSQKRTSIIISKCPSIQAKFSLG